jgi:hypothetical protein
MDNPLPSPAGAAISDSCWDVLLIGTFIFYFLLFAVDGVTKFLSRNPNLK